MVKVEQEFTRLYHEYQTHHSTKGADPFSSLVCTYFPGHGDVWLIVEAVARGHPEALRARFEELGCVRVLSPIE